MLPISMSRSWKKQMALIWASQFLSIMGFSFALPFAPYFLQQELGVVRHGELQLWVALFSASTAVTMAVAAPLWGLLADRYGKRLMLIRANFAGAEVMSLMGAAQTPLMLIVLRALSPMPEDRFGGDADRMRAVFSRRLGVTPVEYRAQFHALDRRDR